MKVVFFPSNNSANKYVDIIKSGLAKEGCELLEFSEVFDSLEDFKSLRVVHFNWYENVIGTKDFILKLVKLLLIKLGGKKIVWTMHNRLPHDKKSFKKRKIMIFFLRNFSNRILVHSKISKKMIAAYGNRYLSKTKYVPHPDYKGVYGDVTKSNEIRKDENRLKLLFIGKIEPYKNIELIIDIIKEFESEVILNIEGECRNHDYKKVIKESIEKYDNIAANLNFLNDAALINAISGCDLVILPYNLRSSLNSGSVLLSFSYYKSVICPEIGTIKDFEDSSNFLSYFYENDVDHKKELRKIIRKAINLHKKDPLIFENWGLNMFEMISKSHDKNKVATEIVKIYNDG